MTDQFSAILSACAGPVALFIDFDGTLVDIAPRPDAIEVPETLIERLGALEESLGGALALISGRTIADIDGFLAEAPFTISGSHGAEQRHRGSRREPSLEHSATARTLSELLDTKFETDERILVERKPTGVAVHFRAAPERGGDVRAAMDGALAKTHGFHAIEGKMVIEARPSGTDKGNAITALMNDEPFRSRTPVFIGDDVTDEDGFRAVNALDGISVKVGPGETEARFRLPDVAAVHTLLDLLAARQATSFNEAQA